MASHFAKWKGASVVWRYGNKHMSYLPICWLHVPSVWAEALSQVERSCVCCSVLHILVKASHVTLSLLLKDTKGKAVIYDACAVWMIDYCKRGGCGRSSVFPCTPGSANDSTDVRHWALYVSSARAPTVKMCEKTVGRIFFTYLNFRWKRDCSSHWRMSELWNVWKINEICVLMMVRAGGQTFYKQPAVESSQAEKFLLFNYNV